MNRLALILQSSIELLDQISSNNELLRAFERASMLIAEAVYDGHTLFVIGNGGSAAEAQHFAAEIVGRYKKERQGLSAIALTTDTSALTAIGNDYLFENIFSRQLEALGRPGDVLLALSTSGNSKNILNALEQAKKIGIKTIGFGGKNGGAMKQLVDIPVIVPSEDTPRIQEIHLLLIHAFVEEIDEHNN